MHLRPHLRPALLALALLALSGCGGGSPSAPAPQPPQDAAVEAPAPAPPAPGASAELVLRGDGLDLVEGGATQQLRFGATGRDELATALELALGNEVGTQPVECGQGPRTAMGGGGFDVLLEGETFVGWDESGGDGRAFQTEQGLALGSTRAEVQTALPDATFTQDTLGPEFSSPTGLGGFLDGTQPTARVVGLTGGEACVVR